MQVTVKVLQFPGQSSGFVKNTTGEQLLGLPIPKHSFFPMGEGRSVADKPESSGDKQLGIAFASNYSD